MYTSLQTRQYYYGGYYGNSNWYNWGRWVLFGAIIVAAILFFIIFSCISARRRRRQGYAPYRFTNWAHRGPVTYNPNANNGMPMNDRPPPGAQQGYYQNTAPPAYGNNAGYYGESGVTQPPQAYAGNYKPNQPTYAA